MYIKLTAKAKLFNNHPVIGKENGIHGQALVCILRIEILKPSQL
jgi:hypothetical protein